MKKFLLIFGLLLLPQLVFAQTSVEDWSIEKFDTIIDLNSDGSLQVSENISVNYSVEKHGIFRVIPVAYRDEFNNRIKIGFKLGDVLVDGGVAQFSESRSAKEKYIKIGDPEVTILNDHTYTINYIVEKGVLFFDDFDEIYWNVTGDAWEVPVKSASAVVRLPDGVEVLQTSCYTGSAGSTTSDCGIATDGSVAAFAAQDFLTVAVGFQKGVVAEPTFWQKLQQSLMNNLINLLPLLLIFITSLIWFKYGKDKKMGAVVAEYEIPYGELAVYLPGMLSPFAKKPDIAAMIVTMAVTGYMSISVQDEEKSGLGKIFKASRVVTLIKKKDGLGLDTAHSYLFNLFFANGRSQVTNKELKDLITVTEFNELTKLIQTRIKDKGIYSKKSMVLMGLLIFLGLIEIFVGVGLGSYYGPLTTVLFVFSGVVTVIFALLMPRTTTEGLELGRRIRGYRLFLATAEKYRIKWQEEENVFEKHLPFAIVFGLTFKWAEAFSGLKFEQPDWYKSDSALTSYSAIAIDLNQAISVGLVSDVVPKSSGSAGGGTSGGGMGGGGGGSW